MKELRYAMVSFTNARVVAAARAITAELVVRSVKK
jgi:hypothetical protein